MMANSGYELEKEFEEVKNISMQWNASFEVAQMPEHREKNRYSNILPCNYIYIHICLYSSFLILYLFFR